MILSQAGIPLLSACHGPCMAVHPLGKKWYTCIGCKDSHTTERRSTPTTFNQTSRHYKAKGKICEPCLDSKYPHLFYSTDKLDTGRGQNFRINNSIDHKNSKNLILEMSMYMWSWELHTLLMFFYSTGGMALSE